MRHLLISMGLALVAAPSLACDLNPEPSMYFDAEAVARVSIAEYRAHDEPLNTVHDIGHQIVPAILTLQVEETYQGPEPATWTVLWRGGRAEDVPRVRSAARSFIAAIHASGRPFPDAEYQAFLGPVLDSDGTPLRELFQHPCQHALALIPFSPAAKTRMQQALARGE
ncbi:MAG: hypothetical protein AAF415_06105 [Pseudomonadota bacterium]